MTRTWRLGPEGGPFVEFQEENGQLNVSTPEDSLDLTTTQLLNVILANALDANAQDIQNVGALDATSATIDGNSSPFATDPHDNTQHSVDFAEDPHDNTQHSETYATTTEVDTKADDPHGNAAHNPNMVESGDYPDLQIDGITVDSTDTINFIPE